MYEDLYPEETLPLILVVLPSQAVHVFSVSEAGDRFRSLICQAFNTTYLPKIPGPAYSPSDLTFIS